MSTGSSAGTWVAPGRTPERILAYGPMGTWKTTGAITIGQQVAGKVWVVDTDNAWTMILDRAFPDMWEKTDVTVVQDWDDVEQAMERIWKTAKKGDWVVLDSTSDLWDMCMDHFSEKLIGKDVASFLANFAERTNAADAKKQGVQGALVEMGVYDYVNPTWRKVMVKRTKVSPFNIYMTAHAAEAGKNPREDALTKSLYGNFGMKPRTQKDIGFNAATVLLLGKNKLGTKGEFTVVKDWGRSGKENPRDVAYDTLGMGFLFKHAGWRPAKKEG